MLETSLFVTLIAILVMLVPGPDFFLTIKNAARYPRNAALMTSFGLICGVATHMTYCVAGLAVVITTTPWLFKLLKYAGAIWLIYIGTQALLARGHSQWKLENIQHQTVSLKKAFLQGYFCNLLNPKATLFFLSVFTQVLNLDSSINEKLWYAGIILSVSVIWWPILVFLIQSKPVRHALAKTQKVLDKILGGILVALGIKVAFF